MLTGELPIGRFESPSEKVQIDVRLDEVVLRTLEKKPQRRYQAASEIKSDLQSIASMPGNAFAPTLAHESVPDFNNKAGMPLPSLNVQQQETAARLLVSRRELMDRVKNSLRPLRRGQIIQVMIGIFAYRAWSSVLGEKHRHSPQIGLRFNFARLRRHRHWGWG